MNQHDFLILDENYLPAASNMIRNAEQKIFITAFKMQPARTGKNLKLAALYRALELAVQKKVAVKILLNQIWGKNTIGKMNTLTAELLKKKSIDVRTLFYSRTIHAKIIIADDSQMLIGSHNWSTRSLSQNFELSLLVKNELIIKQAQAIFIKLWNEAKPF